MTRAIFSISIGLVCILLVLGCSDDHSSSTGNLQPAQTEQHAVAGTKNNQTNGLLSSNGDSSIRVYMEKLKDGWGNDEEIRDKLDKFINSGKHRLISVQTHYGGSTLYAFEVYYKD